MDFRKVKVGDEVVAVSGSSMRVVAIGRIYSSDGDVLLVADGDFYRVDAAGQTAYAIRNTTITLIEPTRDLRDECERQRLSAKVRGGLAYKTLDELRKIAWACDHEEEFEIPGGGDRD